MNDPVIKRLLLENSQITGFCTSEGATLTLELKPESEHKIYRKQYKVPQRHEKAMNAKIESWYKNGKIIEAPPGCPFNNPLTGAPKKDEQGNWTGTRTCEDTRAINQHLLTSDKFQIPSIRDNLELFERCSIFSEFDLEEAYLQFQLHPSSQPYTAFTWQHKQYMFVGCPFGISILPSWFQRFMSRLFADLNFVCAYFDNLPVGSRSWQEHREHIIIVLTRLNEANLKIKPSSIKIGHAQLVILGHLLSAKGIGVDPKKIQMVEEWPLPKTGKELHSFVGFVTFIRGNIRHAAELLAPFEKLKLLDKQSIEWNDELIASFALIKKAIAHAPHLKFPEFDRPFYVATDASNTGIGGVLYQPMKDDNGEITANNIVSFCSKKLNDAQLNYPAFKKELYGVVYSLQYFHYYLWGRNDVVVVTDHKPLVHVLESPKLSETLRRWLDIILEYHFTIIYRPGILNVLPDFLSRIYTSMYDKSDAWGVISRAAAASILKEWNIQSTAHDESNSTANITYVRLIDLCEVSGIEVVNKDEGDIQEANHDQADNNVEVDDDDPGAVRELSIAEQADLIAEMERRGKKLPKERLQQRALVRNAHLLGHFGRDAVYRQLYHVSGWWWPGMKRDIAVEIANCDPCARYTVVKTGYHPFSFITAVGPWDHLQIDTSVHLPESADGFKSLLVIIDVFTGFIVLRPLRQHTAEEVAKVLLELFMLFGLPKIIQSDNGPEFVNEIIREFVTISGIDHRLISPYNPRADGKVERSIGTIMGCIKKQLHGSDKHWPLFTPFTQYCFNSKVAALTNSSAFALMFNRLPNQMKNFADLDLQSMDITQWRQKCNKVIEVIYPAVASTILDKKQRMVEHLNKRRNIISATAFPSGATVMLKDAKYIKNPELKPKFEPKYVGPYFIVRRARNGAYVVKDESGMIVDRHVPADQMKLVSKEPRRIDEQKPTFEVKRIKDHRGNRADNYEYLTVWRGYDDDEATWEPASNFVDDAVIKKYWKEKQISSTNANSEDESTNELRAIAKKMKKDSVSRRGRRGLRLQTINQRK